MLLVDADSYGASIAAMLGLLDEAAGLAQACRLADQGLLDGEALLRVAVPVVTKTGTFHVLTGITRADRWTELRAAALSLVLARARQVAEVIVIDTGFCLESDEELSFDTMAPRRNAATLRSLELADDGVRRRGSRFDWRPEAGPWSRRAGIGRPACVPAGGAEQGPPVRGGTLPGTATSRCVGQVRPCRPGIGVPPGGSGLDRRGTAVGIPPAGGCAGLAAPTGYRRTGLCTRPAKPRILCIFFHSEAPPKGLGSP